MAFVCFDIETSDIFDLKPGESLDDYAPFHVAVAATMTGGRARQVWLSLGSNGKPERNMRRDTAQELLNHLNDMQEQGHMLCAWNGASFDLQWIGFAAGDMRKAALIALDLYDPMFQFFNSTGFPVGLEAVAEGMELGMHKTLKSEDAPILWSKGAHDQVIEYVCADVNLTHAVVERISIEGTVTWITRKGSARSEDLGELKSVRQVLQLPEPDQSWMDTPIPRSNFVGWIQKSLE